MIIVADQQEITRYALLSLLKEMGIPSGHTITVASVSSAIGDAIAGCVGTAMVIMDYAALNMTEDELLLLHLRYPQVHFLLFSESLSRSFLRRLVRPNRAFSVVLKDARLAEIREALTYVLKGRQYICTDAQSIIDSPTERESERLPLSDTECEILRLMALGKKSKDIANERYLSVHTVMTHRKNIFRKLHVNNAQEAIRYGLRAGIVDPVEYYI